MGDTGDAVTRAWLERDAALARLQAIESSSLWKTARLAQRVAGRVPGLLQLGRRLAQGVVSATEGKPAQPPTPVAEAPAIAWVPDPQADAATNLWNKRYAADGGAAIGAATQQQTTGDPIHYMLYPFLYGHSVSKLVTGDKDVWWLGEMAQRYLRPAADRVLSIGCGTAITEEWLLTSGHANHVTAFEMAGAAVEVARQRVAGTPLEHRFDLRAGDVLEAGLPDGSFDLVYVSAAIHHFSDIEGMFQLMNRVLKPGGLLLYDEYVGPDHHIHPASLYDLMDEVNACLDPRYRMDYWSLQPRTAVKRASLAEMLAHDPSEGIHASRILPLTYQYFDVIDRRDFGSAMLRSFFAGILLNFDFDDPKDQTVGRLIVLIEHLMLRHDVIPSHGTIVVARRREAPRPPLTEAECARINYMGWRPPWDAQPAA